METQALHTPVNIMQQNSSFNNTALNSLRSKSNMPFFRPADGRYEQ